MGVITFNGKTSTTYGIHVEKPPKYTIAEKSYEHVNIPGRNGELFYSNNSYKNVPREYEISFYNESGNMETIANNLYEFLYSANGYARLEDTYDSNVFRLAYYVKKLDLENILFKAGKGKIEFNCKPQRYIKNAYKDAHVAFSKDINEGTYPQWASSVYSESTDYHVFSVGWYGIVNLQNSTYNPAYPLIRIVTPEAAGTEIELRVGSSDKITVTVPSSPPDYYDIDCELMEAYCGSRNLNNCVTFNSTNTFYLPPKATTAVQLVDGKTAAFSVIKRTWLV